MEMLHHAQYDLSGAGRHSAWRWGARFVAGPVGVVLVVALLADGVQGAPRAGREAKTMDRTGYAATVEVPKARRAEPEVGLNRRWAEQAFSEAPGAPSAAERLILVKEGYPGDTKVGRCAAGPPLRLGGKTFGRGIGVNSHCELRVEVGRPAARFRALIGLDDNVAGTVASVRFHVVVDGKEAYATEVMRPQDGTREIDVPLAGARSFELVVDEGGDGRAFDQADWANARVALEDGAELWLDDLARRSTVGTGLPFSFVYGGRPSSEFLGEWRRQLTEEAVDAGRRRSLTLTDPRTGLEVRAAAILYTDVPGVNWTVTFTNTGTVDTPILEQVRAVDMTVHTGLGAAPVLHRLTGSACRVDDWMPLEDSLAPGSKVEWAPSGGKSSQGASPFFDLAWGDGGVTTAIGWSGQWGAAVERRQDGALRLQAGQQGLRVSLRPGESLRTPRVLQVYWSGDDLERAHNLFRGAMLAHVLPRVGGKVVAPPIVHLGTSFYELNASTEANTLSHLEAIKGLGFEHFWLDAYWTRDGFPAGMGNYGFPLQRAEPPDRFPRGIRPVSDAAHREGMGFVLWFEPERVSAGTHLAREHPEWVISPGGDGGGLLNLGHPEAREYMTRYLIEAIRAYGVDCLRIDFNIEPLPFWQHLDKTDPDRLGMAEARYVEGLYRMWDDVLKAHPHLFIDNCASGGMRIDLETCSRSVPLWRTDATIDPLMRLDFDQAALQNQVMTAGLGRYLPFSTSGQMGASPYAFRSGFNGGISFCEDCRPPDYPRALLKEGVAEAKRLRRYFAGDFYPLSEVNTRANDWCVLQYHLPDDDAGMVVAFRRHRSSYAAFAAELRGIDPDAEYRVTRPPGYRPSRPVRMRGAALHGLKLEIDECPGSLVVEYRKAR